MQTATITATATTAIVSTCAWHSCQMRKPDQIWVAVAAIAAVLVVAAVVAVVVAVVDVRVSHEIM